MSGIRKGLGMEDRKLVFEKIQNVRDLGGLKTKDGHVIRKGNLIRSANLSEASDQDVEDLKKVYHLAKIIDLRTRMEKAQKPDVYVEGAEYENMPIFDEQKMGISHEKGTDRLGAGMLPVMEDLYQMLVSDESCLDNFRKALLAVMEHDFSKGSVLWHCTEGKDRCGLLTVFILEILGVDRKNIIEDYLMTNEVNLYKAEMYYKGMIASGKTEKEAEAVKNIFLAKESYLNAAYDIIEKKYRGIDEFIFRGLNLSNDKIIGFRERMLK